MYFCLQKTLTGILGKLSPFTGLCWPVSSEIRAVLCNKTCDDDKLGENIVESKERI